MGVHSQTFTLGKDKMKKALVVGATGTLGKVIVEKLESENYSIIENWKSESRPDLRLDKAFENISTNLDVAIYAAGLNAISSIEKLSLSEWNEIIQINLTSAFNFSKAIITSLDVIKTRIIFLSSIMAQHPYPNRIAYSTAKGGLESLTRSLAVESRGRFSVLTIRLGHINKLMASTKTNKNLLPAVKSLSLDNNLTTPKEVADLVVDLIPHIPLLNGAILEADRGYSINRWPLGQDLN